MLKNWIEYVWSPDDGNGASSALTPSGKNEDASGVAAEGGDSIMRRQEEVTAHATDEDWIFVDHGTGNLSDQKQQDDGTGNGEGEVTPPSSGTSTSMSQSVSEQSDDALVVPAVTTGDEPTGYNTKAKNTKRKKMERSWLVEPPACFTPRRRTVSMIVEHSPLDDLLIEHPSMSVYNMTLDKSDDPLDGMNINDSDEDDGVDMKGLFDENNKAISEPRTGSSSPTFDLELCATPLAKNLDVAEAIQDAIKDFGEHVNDEDSMAFAKAEDDEETPVKPSEEGAILVGYDEDVDEEDDGGTLTLESCLTADNCRGSNSNLYSHLSFTSGNAIVDDLQTTEVVESICTAAVDVGVKLLAAIEQPNILNTANQAAVPVSSTLSSLVVALKSQPTTTYATRIAEVLEDDARRLKEVSGWEKEREVEVQVVAGLPGLNLQLIPPIPISTAAFGPCPTSLTLTIHSDAIRSEVSTPVTHNKYCSPSELSTQAAGLRRIGGAEKAVLLFAYEMRHKLSAITTTSVSTSSDNTARSTSINFYQQVDRFGDGLATKVDLHETISNDKLSTGTSGDINIEITLAYDTVPILDRLYNCRKTEKSMKCWLSFQNTIVRDVTGLINLNLKTNPRDRWSLRPTSRRPFIECSNQSTYSVLDHKLSDGQALHSDSDRFKTFNRIKIFDRTTGNFYHGRSSMLAVAQCPWVVTRELQHECMKSEESCRGLRRQQQQREQQRKRRMPSCYKRPNTSLVRTAKVYLKRQCLKQPRK